MEAERLAAIRNRAWNEDAVPSDDVLELLDHIDALQAENERLRQEAINARRARVASLREQNQGLQARVTLLEGLLREIDAAWDENIDSGADLYEVSKRMSDALESIPAVLGQETVKDSAAEDSSQ